MPSNQTNQTIFWAKEQNPRCLVQFILIPSIVIFVGVLLSHLCRVFKAPLISFQILKYHMFNTPKISVTSSQLHLKKSKAESSDILGRIRASFQLLPTISKLDHNYRYAFLVAMNEEPECCIRKKIASKATHPVYLYPFRILLVHRTMYAYFICFDAFAYYFQHFLYVYYVCINCFCIMWTCLSFRLFIVSTSQIYYL